jgi:hypothetical protein
VFLSFVFKQRGETVELPPVEFLIPALPPVTRATVLLLTNLAQLTDGDATDFVVDTLLNDVFGKSV